MTRIGKVVKAASLCCYIFICSTIAWGAAVIWSHPPKNVPGGADAIIVLGSAVRDGKPTATLRHRLDGAANYWQQNKDAVIVVTGGTDAGEKISEAQAMEEYLRNTKGLLNAKIIREDAAQSTEENFKFSKRILDGICDTPYETVFVTNDFHIPRSLNKARKAGLSAVGLAAPTPAPIALNCYIREAFALLFQGFSR